MTTLAFCNSPTVSGNLCKNGKNCHLHRDQSSLDECSICLNSIRRTRGIRDLPCGHSFHRRCIDSWKETGKTTCPLCRNTFDDSKYKVSITIQNTENNTTDTRPLDIIALETLLHGLEIPDPTMISEISINLDTTRDFQMFISDLGIRIADLDPSIFNTE